MTKWEGVLKEWVKLKEKIIIVRTPQYQEWEKVIQKINVKQKELNELGRWDKSEKSDELRSEVSELRRDLENLEIHLSPLSQAAVINKRLNYLFSLETSLLARDQENQQYEERLRLEEEKRNALGKKLEWIKSLVVDNKIERLKTLYKRGDI